MYVVLLLFFFFNITQHCFSCPHWTGRKPLLLPFQLRTLYRETWNFHYTSHALKSQLYLQSWLFTTANILLLCCFLWCVLEKKTSDFWQRISVQIRLIAHNGCYSSFASISSNHCRRVVQSRCSGRYSNNCWDSTECSRCDQHLHHLRL